MHLGQISSIFNISSPGHTKGYLRHVYLHRCPMSSNYIIWYKRSQMEREKQWHLRSIFFSSVDFPHNQERSLKSERVCM